MLPEKYLGYKVYDNPSITEIVKSRLPKKMCCLSKELEPFFCPKDKGLSEAYIQMNYKPFHEFNMILYLQGGSEDFSKLINQYRKNKFPLPNVISFQLVGENRELKSYWFFVLHRSLKSMEKDDSCYVAYNFIDNVVQFCEAVAKFSSFDKSFSIEKIDSEKFVKNFLPNAIDFSDWKTEIHCTTPYDFTMNAINKNGEKNETN